MDPSIMLCLKCMMIISEQPGIISCMSFNPQLPSIFAAGSYLGSIGKTIKIIFICALLNLPPHLPISLPLSSLVTVMR